MRVGHSFFLGWGGLISSVSLQIEICPLPSYFVPRVYQRFISDSFTLYAAKSEGIFICIGKGRGGGDSKMTAVLKRSEACRFFFLGETRDYLSGICK